MAETIRQKIKRAKVVWVYLSESYKGHDYDYDFRPSIRVSKATALRIVAMSPKDNPCTGFVSVTGSLVLNPPEPRS